jgi:hypothetical protein
MVLEGGGAGVDLVQVELSFGFQRFIRHETDAAGLLANLSGELDNASAERIGLPG